MAGIFLYEPKKHRSRSLLSDSLPCEDVWIAHPGILTVCRYIGSQNLSTALGVSNSPDGGSVPPVLDPELQLHVKRLSKKDPTTSTRALQAGPPHSVPCLPVSGPQATRCTQGTTNQGFTADAQRSRLGCDLSCGELRAQLSRNEQKADCDRKNPLDSLERCPRESGSDLQTESTGEFTFGVL